jgi:hypothetical protein
MLVTINDRALDLETKLASMAFKQKIQLEDIELLKSQQIQQHDLQSKLRMSEKTRLELLSSLCDSEATIKKLKNDLMRLQENQQNSAMQERLIIEENDSMWSSRLKLLHENFEKEKQSLLMKLEKEQQLNSEREKLRALMHRSDTDAVQLASDVEKLPLPSKILPRQNNQTITLQQKQGEYQAAKKPRTTTPNTSRKMPANSLQVAAVNSIKNHVLKHPNENDSDDFIGEGQTPKTIEESMPWHQVMYR